MAEPDLNFIARQLERITLATMLMLTVFAGPSIAASIVVDPTKPWPGYQSTTPDWNNPSGLQPGSTLPYHFPGGRGGSAEDKSTPYHFSGGRGGSAEDKSTVYPNGLALEMEEADHWTIANLTFKELPPVEYDHPVKGPVVVVDYKNETALRAACNVYPPAGYLVGCAPQLGNPCQILLLGSVNPAVHGLTRNIVLRHEMAHCNGWPRTHEGIR
jgi:hypothetical protein